MKLNEYGIFEYAKNGHSLGALVAIIHFYASPSLVVQRGSQGHTCKMGLISGSGRNFEN